MADELLRKPRKKRCGRLTVTSPFPIPIETITGTTASNLRWYYYFGMLKSDHIAVYRKGDLTYLYRLGFFGKGILSKGQPQFETHGDVLLVHAKKEQRSRALNLEVKETKLLAVQHERLRQHSNWAKEAENTINKDLGECKQSHKDSLSHRENLHIPVDEDEALPEDYLTDGEDSNDEIISEDLSTEQLVGLLPVKTEVREMGQKRSLSPEQEVNRKMLKLEDSYKLFEYLQLTFEEAFFLSYGLGCFSVDSENGTDSITNTKILKYSYQAIKFAKCQAMQLLDMWNVFCLRKSDFIFMYTAYHHFRSKGWVVRFGNLFGADFVLYKDGMPFYHASYSVFVKYINEEDEGSCNNFTWKEFGCVGRVNEKIAKEVLVCYVIRPKGLNEEDLKSPKCIKNFKIMETIIRRWVPEKHREVVN